MAQGDQVKVITVTAGSIAIHTKRGREAIATRCIYWPAQRQPARSIETMLPMAVGCWVVDGRPFFSSVVCRPLWRSCFVFKGRES